MQIRLNSDIHFTNEDGTTHTILKGWIISDVVSVSACLKDENLRSVQISLNVDHHIPDDGGVTYQYLLLPKEAFTVEEAPGWQAQARRIEERTREAKAA